MLDALKRLFGFGNGDSGPGDAGGDGAPQGGEMISCEEALGRLFEYLDGELEGDRKTQVARHLEVCKRCYPRLCFEQAFLEAVQRVSRGENAPERVKQRILEFVEEENLGSG
ncbi:MAG: hypothetical protein GWM92_04925 [Gemmatimonadetes bacterium]|nr:hypothetical protein [Gemmatimonadota bacterium]NIR77911.1 hypothetical protein [Gemmatimonadota bacterium]NIT86465.1 hypothetical protein [Gemmatimonadota bacterium]NIU30300.1 hypothetical protein [Gemmatimonadota bacterium]NIU35196.1 hypothetical protein [Gemmatimonadota bacterium]